MTQAQSGSLVDSPATPEQERPRRRQPSAARSSRSGLRDQSLTQFAVIDDENVSQQVSTLWVGSDAVQSVLGLEVLPARPVDITRVLDLCILQLMAKGRDVQFVEI